MDSKSGTNNMSPFPEAYDNIGSQKSELINADEYTLLLFSAIRIESMTLLEIKRRYPEPNHKKADTALRCLVDGGLVKLNSNSKYESVSKAPFVSFEAFAYCEQKQLGAVESVFTEFYKNQRNRSHWNNRSFFSLTGFFTEEQTKALMAYHHKIEDLAIQFGEENLEKGSLKGLTYRRMLTYDMIAETDLKK